MTFTPPEAPRYSWSEIWTAVLTRPSVQTFQEILRDPSVSRRRAYNWMLATWTINAIFIGILRAGQTNAALASMPRSRVSPGDVQGFMLVGTLCALPFVLLFGFLGFRIMVGFVQFVARQLGGDRNYESIIGHEKAKNSDVAERKSEIGVLMTYSFAAIQAPLTIVSLLFAALPANAITGIISLVASFYQFYLMSLALRTVYGFSTMRAIATLVLTFVLVFVIFVAVIFGIVFLLARL